MSALIIATGSNLGDKLHYLQQAKDKLCHKFEFVAQSRVYSSEAVGYLDQPSFYNQVLQFKEPSMSPESVLATLLDIEKDLGRIRDIPQGPRTIDIDLLFFSQRCLKTPDLEIPHPRLWERSFVVKPLMELPYFKTLEKNFDFSFEFSTSAVALTVP